MTVFALQFFPTPQSVGVGSLVNGHLDGLESGGGVSGAGAELEADDHVKSCLLSLRGDTFALKVHSKLKKQSLCKIPLSLYC